MVCAGALVSAAGCTGSGRLDLIPLVMKDLDPARPQITRFRPAECYYRLDEEGRIRVAMRYENIAWFGPLSKVALCVSLWLEEPPAGSARTYKLRGDGVRGWAMAGPQLHRFRSSAGIAAVHDVEERSLRGRFRCFARHQSGNALTGWRGNATLLMLGEFHAVRNEAKARELEAQSESGGWAREPASATHPVTEPATAPNARLERDE
jgi:hypothetical protein